MTAWRDEAVGIAALERAGRRGVAGGGEQPSLAAQQPQAIDSRIRIEVIYQ